MPEITKEEADAALTKAISDHAIAYGFIEEGEVLDHFGIISCWPDLNNRSVGTYILQFHQEDPPMHILRGLFEQALHILNDHGGPG